MLAKQRGDIDPARAPFHRIASRSRESTAREALPGGITSRAKGERSPAARGLGSVAHQAARAKPQAALSQAR